MDNPNDCNSFKSSILSGIIEIPFSSQNNCLTLKSVIPSDDEGVAPFKESISIISVMLLESHLGSLSSISLISRIAFTALVSVNKSFKLFFIGYQYF